jgi:recombination protein RecR
MNIQKMMQQAQQMQEKMQKQMAAMKVEATAGGGVVAVSMNGSKQPLSITIDPEAVSRRTMSDAAGHDRGGRQRRAAQGRRRAAGTDERHDGRMRFRLARARSPVTLPEPLERPVDGSTCRASAKSAQRLAFHLLKTPRDGVERLAQAMRDVKDRVTHCSVCSNITDADPCAYCTAADRDHSLICVVEDPQNVTAIEKTRGFKGVYHVLMGTLSPLHGVGPDDLKIKSLLERVAPGAITEVILATNPTVEGEATAIYLTRLLKPLGVRVSRIAMGVPVGSDLEFADEITMSKAMEGRREL